MSVNIRGLVEWHLVRRTRVAGSRKDHYEAATDFWRVMQEISKKLTHIQIVWMEVHE